MAIYELKWDADKERRISVRLESRYRSHMIFHKQGMGALAEELIQFPDGAHDDLLDCVQGLVQLLSEISLPSIHRDKPRLDAFKWFERSLDNHNRIVPKYPPNRLTEVPFKETFR